MGSSLPKIGAYSSSRSSRTPSGLRIKPPTPRSTCSRSSNASPSSSSNLFPALLRTRSWHATASILAQHLSTHRFRTKRANMRSSRAVEDSSENNGALDEPWTLQSVHGYRNGLRTDELSRWSFARSSAFRPTGLQIAPDRPVSSAQDCAPIRPASNASTPSAYRY
jgi:hypothetical protein